MSSAPSSNRLCVIFVTPSTPSAYPPIALQCPPNAVIEAFAHIDRRPIISPRSIRPFISITLMPWLARSWAVVTPASSSRSASLSMSSLVKEFGDKSNCAQGLEAAIMSPETSIPPSDIWWAELDVTTSVAREASLFQYYNLTDTIELRLAAERTESSEDVDAAAKAAG
ncbi:hypothetical protein DFS33DRAFT_1377518 [Desarmillaria ectypa]|nr:hypothetical protein DFS33DRAFT_1377518 [Desarmillaria ectypa]